MFNYGHHLVHCAWLLISVALCHPPSAHATRSQFPSDDGDESADERTESKDEKKEDGDQEWRPDSNSDRFYSFEQRGLLEAWLVEHILEPYPDRDELQKLSERTRLGKTKIYRWCSNWRMRAWVNTADALGIPREMLRKKYAWRSSDACRDPGKTLKAMSDTRRASRRKTARDNIVLQKRTLEPLSIVAPTPSAASSSSSGSVSSSSVSSSSVSSGSASSSTGFPASVPILGHAELPDALPIQISSMMSSAFFGLKTYSCMLASDVSAVDKSVFFAQIGLIRIDEKLQFQFMLAPLIGFAVLLGSDGSILNYSTPMGMLLAQGKWTFVSKAVETGRASFIELDMLTSAFRRKLHIANPFEKALIITVSGLPLFASSLPDADWKDGNFGTSVVEKFNCITQ